MLKVLRKKGVMKKVLWVIAIVIIVVFGLAGQAYLLRDRGRPDYAGRIFGKKISHAEFDEQYQQVRVNAMMRYREDFRRVRDELKLESQTWDRLILLHEARQRKIRVTDEEVVQAVENFDWFQRDGRFDRWLYNDVLSYGLRISPRAFEEGLRDTLKILRLYEDETADVRVNDDEVLAAYRWQNEKIQVSYVFVPAEDYVNQVTYDETSARKFFDEHRAEFTRPETINVEILRFDFPEGAVDGAKKNTGKAENAASSTDGEGGSPADVREETLQLAQEVSRELQEHGDFEKAAADHGLTRTVSGPFSAEQPALQPGWSFPIAQAILALPTDQISEPFETDIGYQIVRVFERHPPSIPTYEEAAADVRDRWMIEQAKAIARKRAGEVREALADAFASQKRPDFVELARKQGHILDQTPVFGRGQYLPRIGLNRAFQQAAFSLTADEPLSGVVETDRGFAILHLDEVFPVKVADFEKNREAFAKKILDQKREQAFNEFLILLRLKSHLEDNVQNNGGAPPT